MHLEICFLVIKMRTQLLYLVGQIHWSKPLITAISTIRYARHKKHLVLSHEKLTTNSVSDHHPLGDVGLEIIKQNAVRQSKLCGICGEVNFIIFDGITFDVQ